MTKRTRQVKFVRATPELAAEAIRTADWDRIGRMTGEDIAELIKDYPDRGVFDPDKPDEIVLPRDVDIAAIRRRLRLSQARFAKRIGVSARLVCDWEQGRQQPVAAARALLLIPDELGAVALQALAGRAA